MCGIVGYIGSERAVPILVEGLKKLEYRGYDSAGVAVLEEDQLHLRKSAGNLAVLDKIIQKEKIPGCMGLGHTRWATHGAPTDKNAHPHLDCAGEIAVVHNGIIENFQEIKAELEKEGHSFATETDTEVVAHLIEKYYEGELVEAVHRATQDLAGSYALAVIHRKTPDRIVAFRQDSPLILGIGADCHFLASDIPALLPYTREVVILEEGEMAELKKQSFRVWDPGGQEREKEIEQVQWDVQMAEKKGYPHYMLKEIYEQPAVLRQLLQEPLSGDQVEIPGVKKILEQMEDIERIFIVACGTAYHSGLIGKFLLERAWGIPVEVDVASEFRYREPLIGDKTLLIVVSQSGETADTLGALRYARARQAPTLGIINVRGSTIAREADNVLFIEAGPEIAVASTKAFFNMVAAFNLLALKIGGQKGNIISPEKLEEKLRELPALAEKTLQGVEEGTRQAASYFQKWNHAFFVGRGLDYCLALEGALKLKEISYIHAEAHAAGELKHGTLALIEEGIPVIAIITREDLLEKMVSNIQEIRARGGYVIGIAPVDFGPRLGEELDRLLLIPATEGALAPLLATIPLQLLSYHAARLRGCPIDQPRNLAKSVTVE